jgi:hypothetical protein
MRESYPMRCTRGLRVFVASYWRMETAATYELCDPREIYSVLYVCNHSSCFHTEVT